MFGANCETFCLLMECLGKMFVDKSCLTFLNVMECSGEMFGANCEMFVNHFQLKAAKYPGRRKNQAPNTSFASQNQTVFNKILNVLIG